MTWYRYDTSAKRLTLTLHIQPGAKRTEIIGLHGDALKVKVAAPPVDGAANEALTKFLAQRLGVPQRDVQLRAGAANRRKIVDILNIVSAENSVSILF